MAAGPAAAGRIPFALTVDVEPDYWDPAGTRGLAEGLPAIVSLLESLGARGTFFWTAGLAAAHPLTVRDLASRGHEIGCHGYRHEDFGTLGFEEQARVLGEAREVFRSLGVACAGFRAPRLRVSPGHLARLREAGFRYDSSTPYWGLRRWRRGDRAGAGPAAGKVLPVLRCIPGYAFRLHPALFPGIVRRSAARCGHAVFFIHPWEVVDGRAGIERLPWHRRHHPLNTLEIGPGFLASLAAFLARSAPSLRFATCAELVP